MKFKWYFVMEFIFSLALLFSVGYYYGTYEPNIIKAEIVGLTICLSFSILFRYIFITILSIKNS